LDLDIQPVRSGLADYQEIKQLYMRAFPAYEREKWAWLIFKSHFKHADFEAFYDQGQFVGFAYVIHVKGLHYVLYLAVNDRLRSQGYGSRILTTLKQHYHGVPLALDVEAPDPTAANNHQRLRRLAFYRKNGFRPTSRKMKDPEVTYQVLTTTNHFNGQKVDHVFDWFEWPFGWLAK